MVSDPSGLAPEPGDGAQPEGLGTIRRRLGLSAAWTTGTWLFTFLLGYPTSILLVRTMSHTQYGIYAVASAIVAFGLAIGGFGLSPATAFLAAKLREEQGDQGVIAAMRAAFRLSAIGCVLAGLAGAGIAFALHESQTWEADVAPFAVLAPILLLAPVTSAMSGLLQSLFRPVIISLASLLQAVLRVALVVFFVLMMRHPSALAAASTQTAGAVAGSVVLAIGVYAWRAGRFTGPRLAVPVGRLARFGAAMVLSSAAWTAVSQLDVFVLGMVKGTEATGLYAPVSQLAATIFGLPALFGAYLLPSLSGLVSAGRTEEVAHTYHWASRWCIVLSAGPIAAMIVSPGPLLTLVYGPAYEQLAGPATILGLGAAFTILVGYNVVTLSAHGLASLTTLSSACGLVVSAVLCVLLIPVTGAMGAAIATSGAGMVINVLVSTLLAARCGISPYERNHVLTVLAFAGSLGVCWLLTQTLGGAPAAVVCLAVMGTSFVVTGTASLALAHERRLVMEVFESKLRTLSTGRRHLRP